MCLCLIMEPNLMQSFSLKELDGHANLLIFNGNLLPEVDPSDSLEWLNPAFIASELSRHSCRAMGH